MTSNVVARWCIETDDRIGMVRDLVTELASMAANVEAMEVVAGRVFVRVRVNPRQLNPLRRALLHTPGIRQIDVIEQLPFEADEQTLIRRVMHQTVSGPALSFDNLVIQSPCMQDVVRLAKAAAVADVPVLITGDSGTGKELFARAVHNASSRRHSRLVPLNCAAIPESLMESELFGYVEGAFTGAARGGRPGLFEVADNGTLFLDEVGELSPLVQAKLLRVIAEKEVRRVGSATSIQVNVRLIAATNRNLANMVQNGTFRQDLYYRLHVLPLYLPPLRERKEDILPLADYFLQQLSEKLGRTFVLSTGAKRRLCDYDFPGNIRELQNILERAVYLSGGPLLSEESLLLLSHNSSARDLTSTNWTTGSLDAGQKREKDTGYLKPSASCGEYSSLKECVERYELALIHEALKKHGSLRKAALALGVSHTTLRNKLNLSKLKRDTPGSKEE